MDITGDRADRCLSPDVDSGRGHGIYLGCSNVYYHTFIDNLLTTSGHHHGE